MKKWFGIAACAAAVGLILFVNASAKKKGLSSLNVGEAAPNFTLTDAGGTQHSLSDFKGKYVVLEWTNYGCPYVKKHYDTGNMQSLQKKMTEEGVVWLSICSSAKGKQGHMSAADWVKSKTDQEASYTAVLLDPDGDVGRLYGAKTTPHMFVVDPDGKLIYQGAIDDDSSASKSAVKGAKNYVQLAVDQSMDGQSVEKSQTKPYGCSVKY